MRAEFVMGRNIDEALQRSQSTDLRRYRFSYDMLGEAALTTAAAGTVTNRPTRGQSTRWADTLMMTRQEQERPGISVKLSSLCPRFEPNHQARAVAELTARLLRLGQPRTPRASP